MRGECLNENPDCPFYKEGCYEDTHHLYYPRRDYKTHLEKEFRNLPENKEQLCRAVHSERHAMEGPPQKPSREQMLAAIAISSVPA